MPEADAFLVALIFLLELDAFLANLGTGEFMTGGGEFRCLSVVSSNGVGVFID